ncbi:MAG: hypothetical protein J6A28_02285 [Clostridia bacterium]|nr:hypothetical protein [Clostridia bacterium]
MKLSKLREIVAKAEAIGAKCYQCKQDYMQNPDNATLKRKYALAAAQNQRSIQTLANYMPIFTVTLGDFVSTAKEDYANIGVDCKFTCCNFAEKENGKTGATLMVTLEKEGKSKDYELCTIELEDENQPLADVKFNLLAKMFIKGMQKDSRDARINADFDIIAWDTVAKNLIRLRDDRRIAKAIREEELAAKRKAREELSTNI